MKTAAQDEEPKIRLFDIKSAFVELFQARLEAEEIEDEAERTTALAAVDTAIQEYAQREVQKVDGLRSIIKYVLPAAADCARKERDYQARRLKSIELATERLLDVVKGCMIAFNVKRIDGSAGYFLHKNNGGQLPLSVDGWDADRKKWRDGSVLSNEFKLVTIRIPMLMFQILAGREEVEIISSEPNMKKIRATLDEMCEDCWELGTKCPSGPSDAPVETCTTCGGTGKRGVPGARLLERSSHVEVK